MLWCRRGADILFVVVPSTPEGAPRKPAFRLVPRTRTFATIPCSFSRRAVPSDSIDYSRVINDVLACDNTSKVPHMPEITPEVVREHGLSPDEYKKVLDLLGREPTLTELGIFSVMWSEHCSYKSSRVHLKRLPTRSKLVLQGPGENAGIIDIGEGWACAFKIESHNHPSFIEPFQGATTGVGGILRDIFTMGARPVAVMDSLRFGPITKPHPSNTS